MNKIVIICIFIIHVSCSKSFKYNYAYVTELKAVKEEYQKDTLNFAIINFDRKYDNDVVDLELNDVKIFIRENFTNSKTSSGPLDINIRITKFEGNLFCKFNKVSDSICLGGSTRLLKIKFVINGKKYSKVVDPSKGKWFVISNYSPERVELIQHVSPVSLN